MLNYLVNSTTINFMHVRKVSCQNNKSRSLVFLLFTASRKFEKKILIYGFQKIHPSSDF